MFIGSTGKHLVSYCLKPFWGQAKGQTIGFSKPPSSPLSEGDLGPPWFYSFHLADPGAWPLKELRVVTQPLGRQINAPLVFQE